jgi:SAM-dependent methyltransferase
MELRALAVRDGTIGAYISLGVVEHDPDGPDAILAEARRVLAPGGVIVVSVPYLNGLRRLAAPYLRRRGRRLAARGGSFYQYAFSRAELMDVLRRHGFAPRAAHPYDPVRILRGALKGISVRRRLEGRPHRARSSTPAGGRRSAVREAVRALFYTPPALRLLGHMLLVVAVKA